MAMKPYNEETYGQSNSWALYGGYSTINRVVAKRSLGNVYTQWGDFKTPNRHTYQAVRQRGYTGERVYYSWNQAYNWTKGVQPYVYNWFPYAPTGFDSDVLNSALGRAYDELRGNIDASVDLVQWRQTVRMLALYRRFVKSIVDASKRMEISLRQVRRINRMGSRLKRSRRRARRLARELNRSLNALARARLEYTYGWSPTMGTIHDLCEEAITPPGPGLMVVEGSSRQTRTFKALDYSVDTYKPVEHTVAISERARVKMFYNPSNNIMTDLAKIASLNPIGLLYEVIPFSFVLDWAVDVGGWIRTLETAFLHRNNFIVGWSTQVQRTYVRSEMFGYGAPPGYMQYGTFTSWALTGTAVMTRFDRKLLSSAPYPTKPVKQLKFGVEKQLTALALAKVVLLDADRLIAGRR